MAAFKRTLAFPLRPHFSPAAPPLQRAPGSDPRSTKGVLQHTSRWFRRTQLGHRSHRHSYPTGYYVTEITSSSWYFSIFFFQSPATQELLYQEMHTKPSCMYLHIHTNTHTYLQTPSPTALGLCVCVCQGDFCLCLLTLNPSSAFLMWCCQRRSEQAWIL